MELNVATIGTALNRIKGTSGPLALPLLAEWCRVFDNDSWDLQEKQQRWTWLSNAATNNCRMVHVFRLSPSHRRQAELWSRLSPDEVKAILTTLRTGAWSSVSGAVATKLLNEKELDQPVLRIAEHVYNDVVWTSNGCWTACPTQERLDGGVMYDQLLRIAHHHGISKDDFDEYCTAQVPGRDGERVFFPYHVLSRPHAGEFGWDWHVLPRKIGYVLRTMRRACNLAAEKSNLGEPRLDETMLVHVMATHYCQRIAEPRHSGDRSMEWILWHLYLDRWGLPLMPWGNHIFKVSTCHKQDHGIAMLSGIMEPSEGWEAFDPVQHIDLDRATITFDNVSTNMAMWNYDVQD